MATPFPPGNPYLSHGFEPIRFECDYDDLVIEGEIPADLSGCLYPDSGEMVFFANFPNRDFCGAIELCAVPEPVFVPGSVDSAEGDSYILTVNFEEHRKASHLAVFDARNIASGPVARALLDHRVPMGFHGAWLPRQLAALR